MASKKTSPFKPTVILTKKPAGSPFKSSVVQKRPGPRKHG